jgi:hypothetical protein
MEIYRKLPEELKGVVDRMIHGAFLRAVHKEMNKRPKLDILLLSHYKSRYEYAINEIIWDDDYLWFNFYCVCWFKGTPEETCCHIRRV